MKFLPSIGGWAWVPLKAVRTLIGQNSLQVIEYDKTTVQKPNVWARPLDQPSKDLKFSAWRLAHAVKKADCARWPSSKSLALRSAGFLLEQADLFDWGSGELRLNPGMSDYNADFSGTSLAGRISQGMTLLFLEDEGYSYVGRFEAVMHNFGSGKRSRKAQQKKQKAPDFVVENGVRGRALAEAKGGFLRVGGRPNIKGNLKKALVQLSSGARALNPSPPKSFAVGTYLRETHDCSGEPSLIAYTDPPPDEPEDSVEVSKDAIRRANYASWLSLMGFDDAARRLWTGSGEPEWRTVPVVTLGKNQYVVTIASVRPIYELEPDDDTFWQHFTDWPGGPFRPFPDGIALELIGLDLKVVEALGSPIQGQVQMEELMEIKPTDLKDASTDIDGGSFNGSVLSDRSLLGEFRMQSPRRPPIEVMPIKL